MVSRLRSILFFWFIYILPFSNPSPPSNGDRGGGGVAPFAYCCGI